MKRKLNVTAAHRRSWLCALLVFGLLVQIGTAFAQNVPVRIVAINDFHGHLEPGGNTIAVPDPADATSTVPLRSGGAPFLATLINQLRAEQPRAVVISAGDLVGASPLTSGLFLDEPTIEVMNAVGLEVNALGNHEFDHGVRHLLRLSQGGCAPQSTAGRQSCAGVNRQFAGARFAQIAANVVYREDEQPLVAPTWIKTIDGGVRIGFIGAVTRSTPGIVVPSGVATLRFESESKALNRYARELQAQGVQAIVAVVHEGGEADGGFNACGNPRGPIFDIVRELDPAIDVIVSGHSHRGYTCIVGGRPVTQAASFGRLVTVVDVEIDRASGDIVQHRTQVRNLPVPNGLDASTRLRATYPPLTADPEVQSIVAHYRRIAAPIAQQAVGRIVADFDRRPTAGGDTALGRLIADAQLAMTRPQGAQIAFTNPGGLRADLRATGPGGTVTFADAFAAQPFGNTLVTVSLTGAQLKQLLEQQWSATRPERARMLQPSRGFSYAWLAGGPRGERIVADSLRLDGQLIEPDRRYRITVNDFLADGGDGFRVLRTATDRIGGPVDVDALTTYLREASAAQPLAPDRTPRIFRR